jgi:hypothetical protein
MSGVEEVGIASTPSENIDKVIIIAFLSQVSDSPLIR